MEKGEELRGVNENGAKGERGNFVSGSRSGESDFRLAELGLVSYHTEEEEEE